MRSFLELLSYSHLPLSLPSSSLTHSLTYSLISLLPNTTHPLNQIISLDNSRRCHPNKRRQRSFLRPPTDPTTARRQNAQICEHQSTCESHNAKGNSRSRVHGWDRDRAGTESSARVNSCSTVSIRSSGACYRIALLFTVIH